MATVREVRTILEPFGYAIVTKAEEVPAAVHVKGFVTSTDLKVLVERYDVMLHTDGFLCVE